uniref:Extended synaptotagmin-3 n=1 Tax=Labrus bergylta TaxID=56723 RepID=A0A3Q3NIK6_9LABR
MIPSSPAEGAALRDSLSVHGSTEKLNPSAVNRILMEFLMYFGRAFIVFYPVYLTGYMGLSISWVLLCMVMVTWWKKNRQWKDSRIGTAIDFVDNEKQVVNKELQSALQMATWVHFPDVEKVNWLNKVLEQAWPFFGMYMEKLLKENIQPAVRLSSAALKVFTFTKIHFGHIPLRITGMRAYTHEVDHREVLKGTMRVILEPLIGQAPLVGGVTFFFIRRPTLEINWTGMTNLLDSPAFRLVGTIMDTISSMMVLPNRMCIPLIEQVKVDQMRFPLPRGVVRVHLIGARDLVAKDTFMMGLVKGKSDPYATVRVGNLHFKTKTVKENLHPTWNEVHEFVVHEAPGQELEWFPLEGVPNGEVHLKLQWFSLLTDPNLETESADGFACAMLAVYLDNASNLPKDHKEIAGHKKHGKHSNEARLTKRNAGPDSYVEFSVDKDVQKSKVVYASKDPVWEEGFTFFVHSVKTQQLSLQVSHEKKTELGVLNIPLSRLVNTSNMTLDQRFPLERSGANSQIKLKATLRILSLEKPTPKVILNPPPHVRQQGPQTNPGGYASESTAPFPASSSQASPPNYLNHRRGSFLASETHKSPSSTTNMRRYDSHSLLSENSMASSRLDLSDGGSYPEAIRKHQGSFGEISVSVRYATLRKKLIILVNSCRNLFPCSENGTDSYVRLYLLPDQTWRHRKKTHVTKRTINPIFNDKFEFDVSLEEAKTRKLDVSVKNNKMLFSRERKDIGMVLIDLAQMNLVNGDTQWYDAHLFSFPCTCK